MVNGWWRVLVLEEVLAGFMLGREGG
jgi:hypothetical protein